MLKADETMFDFDLTDDLRKALEKLSKKSPVIAKAINRKIREIVSRDAQSIVLYKNLRHDLNNLKRVHITEWLVFVFEVDLNRNFILFVKVAHRDEVYKEL